MNTGTVDRPPARGKGGRTRILDPQSHPGSQHEWPADRHRAGQRVSGLERSAWCPGVAQDPPRRSPIPSAPAPERPQFTNCSRRNSDSPALCRNTWLSFGQPKPQPQDRHRTGAIPRPNYQFCRGAGSPPVLLWPVNFSRIHPRRQNYGRIRLTSPRHRCRAQKH